MNPKKEKENLTLQTLKNHLNHFILPNGMENLKLSNEMRLKITRKKGDPSHLFTIKGIK